MIPKNKKYSFSSKELECNFKSEQDQYRIDILKLKNNWKKFIFSPSFIVIVISILLIACYYDWNYKSTLEFIGKFLIDAIISLTFGKYIINEIKDFDKKQ